MGTDWFQISEYFCFLAWIVSIILAVYFNVKRIVQRRETFIQKRPTYFSLNISIISLMTALLFCAIAWLYASIMSQIVAASIAIAAFWFFVISILVKNWMIFYQTRYTHYLMKQRWQLIINTEANVSDNWYIKNTKFKNVRYIRRLSVVFGPVVYIICLIPTIFALIYEMTFIPYLIAVAAFNLTFFPCIAFYGYIVCYRAKWSNDTMLIQWESRFHSKLLLLYGIIVIICVIFHFIFDHGHIYLFGFFACNLTLFVMNFVSTEALFYKLKQHNAAHKIQKSKKKIRTVIDNILQDENAINVFMTHLATEYSMEILLSVIEFNQFQEYVLSHITEIDQSTLEKVKLIQFPSSIPKSSIVYDEFLSGVAIVYDMDPTENAIVYPDSNNNKNAEFKLKAHKLYHKYCRLGSQFEINIRGDIRDSISAKLNDPQLLTATNDLSLIDLLLIFEPAKVEMHQLQLWSLVRNIQNDGSMTAFCEI